MSDNKDVSNTVSSESSSSSSSSDDNSSDTDSSNSSEEQTKKDKTSNEDLHQLLDNYPDVYGVRRSARSRKEPQRYTVENAESDGSDTKKKTKRSKRIDSGDWDSDDSSSDDKKERKPAPRRAKPVKTKRIVCSSSGTESDSDDQRRKATRRATNKKVSYKEQSDHTDSDDLMEVDWTAYEAEAAAEDGETVERVLDHRKGKRGATGLPTAPYQVEENGDPNNGEDCDEKELQFYIKWKNWSHLHNTWETEESLKEVNAKGIKKVENYLKKEEEIRFWKESMATPEDIDYYDCQEEMALQLRQLHMNVERIIAHQLSKGSETPHPEYLCKWEGLPYLECTWEDGALIQKKFPIHIEQFESRQKSQKIPTKLCRALKVRPKFVALKTQPDYIGGKDQLELRDYQLNGLNWLAHSWCKENGVILADEMGLGKTIQTISFLSYLFNHHSLYGPFLLVIPLSTMASWQKEFEIWNPEINVVVYLGDVGSRNMIRSYEWCHPGNKRLKFNVLLTTYEILLKDRSFLGAVNWAVLGVDEAHRLKNDDSLLYKSLFEFQTNHRLLITGTPLQNSLRELWALLHFISPSKFDSWDDFENDHKDSDNKGYSKLHKQLEQFLLRRVKKDVEKSLPAKVEQILRVEMTSIQKQYYKWILTKNYKALTKGVKGSLTGFANIMMELKKCCNHATLVRPVDDLTSLEPLQRLIRCSGKLLLLDKLLCRLRETGHRVLIFSQMVRMLDILGEYLALRRFPYQRLDGSVRGEIRKQALDHFNAEGSPDFCFLLSTRAGGLGINLATADTVVIFDSDWNPQNDLQAQARAHRIGQKNQVNIYRLVTKGSVEEDIIERAKRKMVLDHLVIQRMDTTGRTVLAKDSADTRSSNSNPFNKEELAAILKFGAEELFKEGEDGDDELQCDIDEILRRAETREDVSQTVGDELLSAFKVASFNFNEDEDMSALSAQTPPVDDQNKDKDWEEIIPEADRMKIEEEEKIKEEMEMFLPPRSRKSAQQSGAPSDSGEEYDPNRVKDKDDVGSDDSDGDKPKRRGRPKASPRESVKGFSETEVRKFVKSFKKFPNPLKRLESIAIDAELQEKPMADLKRIAEALQTGCENSVKEYNEKMNSENQNEDSNLITNNNKKNNRGPNFKLGGVSVFPKNILSCEKELEPLDLLLPPTLDEKKKWVLKSKVKAVHWDVLWGIEEDSRLLAGVHEYGLGSWEAIKMDPSYGLADKILVDGDQKPQSKQLQTRVEYLLKFMHKLITAQKLQAEASKPKSKRAVNAKNGGISKVKQNANDMKGNDENKSKDKNKNKEDKKKSKSKEKKSKDKEHKHKDKHKKKDKKKKKKAKDMDLNSSNNSTALPNNELSDDLDPKMFEECKERMRPVKKALKALDKPDISLSKTEQKSHYMQHLRTIGVRIDECLQEFSSDPTKSKEWRNLLWTFVSKFTEYHAKKLYKLYKHSIKSESKASDGAYSSRRDRHDRHYTKQSSNHSSFNPLKRESSSGFSPNKSMKKEEYKHEEYNLFDPKASAPYASGANVSQSQNYRSGWSKHDNMGSIRPMPYERGDVRGDHYSKPKYGSRDEMDRKHRYPNDRHFYNTPPNVPQGQRSASYGNHSQQPGQHSAPSGPDRTHTQYEQHYFSHSSVSVPINQSNQYQSSWSSSSFNGPREQPYHRNPVDSYRRPFGHNSDEKTSLNR
ncbi:unnamed protein product [Medioppia subpectinata]|uniref:Chromodomain-helicase-DNA-binding protein 1 n=1 Tax=Medioppia subpectinata TaxID=1979941 RepID=A0A7R9PUP4_9ACAR|nr:unnamed protein product [Medioppia subpectinata]CAG2101807.1 unnamed protein product [Medioppia subpectinata]